MNAMAAEKRVAAPDLEARGLVKVYGDRTVVNGMNVKCSCGEIVGILGPNGAGKTTTFYMVVGLVKPNAGTVTFRGDSFGAVSTEMLVNLKASGIEIAYVPEGGTAAMLTKPKSSTSAPNGLSLR